MNPIKDKIPLIFKYKKWTETEVAALHLGVQQQNQEHLTKEVIKKYKENNDEKQLRSKIEEIKLLKKEELEGLKYY